MRLPNIMYAKRVARDPIRFYMRKEKSYWTLRGALADPSLNLGAYIMSFL